MKISIVGAGAIGGWIGARLAALAQQSPIPVDGQQTPLTVSAIARGRTLDALRRQGWQLQSPDGDVRCPAHAVDDPAALGPQDVVIIAVKAPALEGLAPTLAPLLAPHTLIVPAMNGVPWWFCSGPEQADVLRRAPLRALDPHRVLEQALPLEQVVACVVHGSASCPTPGAVVHRMGRGLLLGAALGGHPPPRLERLVQLLNAAGFEAQNVPAIRQAIWYKLWGNLTMNPVSALTGATMDRVLADPLLRAFCSQAMEEAAAIGRRIGCPLEQSPEDRHAITERLGPVKTSMLQDVEAGRPLEIDAIVGAVHEIGERLGEPMPAISALLGLIRVMASARGLR